MAEGKKKTLGQAIDEIIEALESLNDVSRPTAIKAACEHLEIDFSLQSESQEGDSSANIDKNSTKPPPVTPPAQHPPASNVRSLKEEKDPKTAQEMACVVAYYLESLAPPNEKKSDLNKADLDKYFKQAKYPLPSRVSQVLVDAKAAGYLDSAGRGKYKLNPVGHNLVVHSLPRSKQ